MRVNLPQLLGEMRDEEGGAGGALHQGSPLDPLPAPSGCGGVGSGDSSSGQEGARSEDGFGGEQGSSKLIKVRGSDGLPNGCCGLGRARDLLGSGVEVVVRYGRCGACSTWVESAYALLLPVLSRCAVERASLATDPRPTRTTSPHSQLWGWWAVGLPWCSQELTPPPPPPGRFAGGSQPAVQHHQGVPAQHAAAGGRHLAPVLYAPGMWGGNGGRGAEG